MDKDIIILQNSKATYPEKQYLFRPHVAYPEYKGELSQEDNLVYDLVRECFHMAGYDNENYGTAEWNPLKEYVKPGNYVVLKPNMVMDYNQNQSGGVLCLYTQPSVVAAVLDYVIIALKGNGHIVVGDAPMQECKFDKLIDESGYKVMIQYYAAKGIDIELVDFRELRSYVKAGVHYQEINPNAHGSIIDIKDESEFSVYDADHLNNLRITNYDPTILVTHHMPGKHEYYISDYIMKADTVINLPKPKTHRKAGVTISLKNLIGINVRKEYLPHHCMGDKDHGGDEYQDSNIFKKQEAKLLDIINYASAHRQYSKARFFRIIKKVNSQFIKLSKDKYREGSWYGNNTISKTITDLNKILLYADKQGVLKNTRQRNLLIVADLIISGEKEGPVCPSPKNVGIIAIGNDSVCFDEAIATIMGMDVKKISTLLQVRDMTGCLRITEKDSRAIIRSNVPEWSDKHIDEIIAESTLRFEPTSGWKGHIEL